MREYNLKIKFRRELTDWGHLQDVGRGKSNYVLRIDDTAPLVKQVGTLLHEFGHMIFYMIFAPEAIDEMREHRFCRKLDSVGAKGFQSYLEGK